MPANFLQHNLRHHLLTQICPAASLSLIQGGNADASPYPPVERNV